MIRLQADRRVALAAWRFESQSTPGQTYDVYLAPSGAWSCECWPFLKRDTCKHVVAARQLLRGNPK